MRLLNKDYKIKCVNLSKVYNLNRNRKDKLLSLITLGLFKRTQPFYALKDINFEIKPGVSVGIIGLNGSGKSTLSNILGGIIEPTTGEVISESTPSLIAIGAGLNKEFTGLENINYKCLMHGMTQSEIDSVINDIISFSELGKFIKQPLKTYSSGMRSRLGFSIAIHTNPKILIIDEALSVGDDTFANKCITKIRELQDNGVIIFFISHSTSQILDICNEVMWIHYGKLIQHGDSKTVVKEYRRFIKEYKELTKETQLEYKETMSKRQQEVIDKHDIINESKVSKLSASFVFILFIALGYMIKIQLGI